MTERILTEESVAAYFQRILANPDIGCLYSPDGKFTFVEPDVVHYLFDGFMGCALVERDGLVYDVGDIDFDTFRGDVEHLEISRHCEGHQSLDDLYHATVKMLSPP